MGQCPTHAILPLMQTILHHSKAGNTKACKNTSFVFSAQLIVMRVDCLQILVFKKSVYKSIINIKHQSTLASCPEHKLQKIISKRDVMALGRTDTGMSSDVVL